MAARQFADRARSLPLRHAEACLAYFDHALSGGPSLPEQPLAGDIEEAAAVAGISYHFVPIIRGIGPADVEEMQKAWREAESGRLLAFCRSGRRSAYVCALAHRDEGTPTDQVIQQLNQAGFDHGPIAHLL